jgi:hypothetical protein
MNLEIIVSYYILNYMKKKHKMKIELTKKEADYLSSLVETQLTKLTILDREYREKEPIRRDFKVAQSLERKFLSYAN